jgi:hypothetical protein
MQPSPSVSELLAAVATVLEELVPVVPPETRHEVRVAINLCGLVSRECSFGFETGMREQALLSSILGHDGDVAQLSAELFDILRTGADDRISRPTWDALVAIARGDLAISKPGYDLWEGP